MTGEIFERFLKDWDRRLGKRKILLLLDNCPAHPRVRLNNIKLQFFIPNATSVVQPCDQGIIQNFKVHYRKILLRRRILAIEHVVDFKFDLLDALYVANQAWVNVKGETIANCFRKAGIFFDVNNTASLQEDEDFEEMKEIWNRLELNGDVEEDLNFVEFIEIDKELITTGSYSPSEIASLIVQPMEVDKDSTDGEENILESPEVTRKQAYKAFTILQRFLRDRGDQSIMKACYRIEDFFQEQSSTTSKQTEILDFFNVK
jgi:hypothetical protein